MTQLKEPLPGRARVVTEQDAAEDMALFDKMIGSK